MINIRIISISNNVPVKLDNCFYVDNKDELLVLVINELLVQNE